MVSFYITDALGALRQGAVVTYNRFGVAAGTGVYARSRFVLLLAVAGVSGGGALAAPVTVPGAVQPGHERQLPQPSAAPSVDFSIVAPQRSPVPRDVDQIHFKLRGIRIEGAVTIPADTFRPLYENLVGRDITLSDILAIADGIEKEYRDRGYLLIRAYVPPQHVSDGIFTIRVVEGFVSNVTVDGGPAATQDLIRDYLEPLRNERPLRLPTIERGMLLANDVPGVSASGVLRPSPDVPGASELLVSVDEPEVSGGLSTDNRGSHFTGIWSVTGTAEYNSIFGADALDATLTDSPHAEEQVGGQVRYRTAIGSDGLIGSLIGAASHGSPGSYLSSIFNLKTDSWAVGPRLTYPLIRSRADSLSIDAGFTVQDATLNGFGINSHDKWRVLDVALTYSGNGVLGGSVESTVDVAQGLSILGATPDNSPQISQGGKTDFTKITGLARYTAQISDSPFGIALTGQGQYALRPLITGEQILFGGTQIGRGYDPGAITGDSGAGGSFELRYNTHVPELSIQGLQPYAFFDAAETWYRHRPAALGGSLSGFSIASAGAGLRFWFPYNIYWDVEVARTLKAVPGSDNGSTTTKFLTDLTISF